MKLHFRLTTLLLSIALFTQTIIAQEVSSHSKAQKSYEQAKQWLNTQSNKEAIKSLKTTISLDPTFAPAQQQLADIYRLENKYAEAIPLYKNVIILNPTLTQMSYFGLGEALLNEGLYNEALRYLKKYEKFNLSPKGRKITNKYIIDCEFAINQNVQHEFIIQKLPDKINTSDNEYFPKLTADQRKIIFTRKTNNLENFYESEFRDITWTLAKKLQGAVNSDLFNEGAHCISPDGKYLFFTGCNRPEGMGSCDIYVSKLENGIWGIPHNLGPTINTKGWESQPAISADGKTLYFVSNRNGGFGGYDIWKTELQNDATWSQPINLGNVINTEYNETSPFIHPDNQTLYFTSNGHPGFGNQDLYLSRKDSLKNWSKPINLGSPINNNLDQNSIQITTDGHFGFYSTQDSTKQLDIYKFDLPSSLKPNAVAYIVGKIIDKESKEALSANITLTNSDTNLEIYNDNSDDLNGQFLITLPLESTYTLHIQKEGYLFYSEQYELKNTELQNKEITKEILLQPIRKGGLIQLNNIYFDINKYTLLPESFIELNILVNFLKINPQLNIEIIGHTDNTGKVENNKLLSENRAISVKNYIVKHGISMSRISTIGLGNKMPITDNITEEGRKMNRRTEIKILN